MKEDVFDDDFLDYLLFDDDYPAGNEVVAESNDPIIKILDEVNSLIFKSGLDPDILERIEVCTTELQLKLNMTAMQLVFISILMEKGCKMDYGAIAKFVNCSRLRIITYADEMHTLLKRRYVGVAKDSDGDDCFYINKEAKDALIQDKEYVAKSYKNLKLKEFLDVMSQLVQDRIDKNISFDYYKDEITALLSSNAKLKFVKELHRMKLSFEDTSVFLACVYYMVEKGMAIDDEIRCLTDTVRYSNTIQSQKSPLFKHNLVEKKSRGFFSSASSIVMTADARMKFLPGIDVAQDCNSEEDVRRGLIRHEDIEAKQLFFNMGEQTTMDELSSMLRDESFKSIKQRLEEKNLRTGFCVCLYGAPGTGKTEFVRQIARLTQRDVMLVDIAGLRDKYVGESEKSVRRIFKSYKKYCDECAREPILFLNEADGIISKRRENVEHSVDTMENAMVDIILNEMENFKGIMFATTNHQLNMDPATERRFIYRVELHKPDAQTRAKIWGSLLPDISGSVAESLSKDYELAGGNIENISRLATVNEVLYGKKPSLEQLQDYCEAEVRGLKKQGERKYIAGFGKM